MYIRKFKRLSLERTLPDPERLQRFEPLQELSAGPRLTCYGNRSYVVNPRFRWGLCAGGGGGGDCVRDDVHAPLSKAEGGWVKGLEETRKGNRREAEKAEHADAEGGVWEG